MNTDIYRRTTKQDILFQKDSQLVGTSGQLQKKNVDDQHYSKERKQ